MPAHVVYPDCDSQPAGFSRFWIGEVLRKRLCFNGAVFSDDLSMVGAHAAGGPAARALAAVEAGCDMVLVCNIAGDVAPVLDALRDHTSPLRQQRLQAMRGRFAVDRERLMASADWRSASATLQALTEAGAA